MQKTFRALQSDLFRFVDRLAMRKDRSRVKGYRTDLILGRELGSRKRWVVQGLRGAQGCYAEKGLGFTNCGFLVLAKKSKLCFERKPPVFESPIKHQNRI